MPTRPFPIEVDPLNNAMTSFSSSDKHSARIALLLRLVLAYPGLRILVFEADVILFLRGQNLARTKSKSLSVWTSSASYMPQITLTLTSSMKIACLYISADPIVTRMPHDKSEINLHKQEQQYMVILAEIVQMHDEWGIVLHLVVC